MQNSTGHRSREFKRRGLATVSRRVITLNGLEDEVA